MQGLRAGDFLFISMQLPLDPVSGSMVRTGVRAQARRVLDNLKGVLEASGATMNHTVKLTVYLSNLDDLEHVNAVMGEILKDYLPARTSFAAAGLPKGAALAMDAVAYLGS